LYIARGIDLAALIQTVTEALAYRTAIEDRFGQLQLLVLKAWLHSKQQSRAIAVKTLGEAEALAQETGYVRVLLDIPDIAKLLHEVTDSSPARKVRRAQAALAPGAPIELTDQECVILDLLVAEYSYQQIADELVISRNTVCTHVRHIYRKLAVHRRERAIERARWLGLIANPTA
jgi:LuxR family transcriptional regulator, maltose regulon positive regulatory protein